MPSATKYSIWQSALSEMPRDFAATLVGIILCDDEFVLCHVGDGACPIRKREGQEWLVPSWPAHGEYASSTYFVTDEPVVNLRITRWQGDFSDVAVFSDGLERLVLDFSQRVAFQPFFDSMLKPLSGIGPGRSRRLSVGLRTFLNSSIVADRTDDDKSLIIATRARTT
jgi:Protein phosphatase 2C